MKKKLSQNKQAKGQGREKSITLGKTKAQIKIIQNYLNDKSTHKQLKGEAT
ncbi:MAG: hypothetical protein HQ521_19905 [Bacteroidetes bacterium]|nr:hypothetical protein [Bacteroidota bacterium]